jgi:fructosamine-3-kinase
MKHFITKCLESIYGSTVKIKNSRSVSGGSINQCQVLELSNGTAVFLKLNENPPNDFFTAEQKSLNLLRSVPDGPRVPKPISLGPGTKYAKLLMLEYIEPASPTDGFYETFAQALAHCHRSTQCFYGLDHDNYIGRTDQINTEEKDPIVFFRENRIRFQQKLARQSGLIDKILDNKLDHLNDKLASLLDVSGEKPALVHGDLWSGNYFADRNQVPCIFDPAAHYGLRESDLAMTELFGRLPQSFYDAYHEAFPLNPGYETRKDLYNLYHLLNHLNLFGRSYLSQVEATVNHYLR